MLKCEKPAGNSEVTKLNAEDRQEAYQNSSRAEKPCNVFHCLFVFAIVFVLYCKRNQLLVRAFKFF